MKKLLLILLVLPFIIVGCSSDDDNNGYGNNDNYAPNQIVGTWVYHKTSVQELITNSKKADEVIKADIESEDDRNNRYQEIWTFNEDGTMELQFDPNDILTGFYTLTGNKISMKLYDIRGQLDEVIVGKISLSKNMLFFYYDVTDEYQDDIRHYLPNDYEDVIIYSVIGTDSFKKMN